MSNANVFVGVLNPPGQPLPPPIAEWVVGSALVGQLESGFSFFVDDLDFDRRRLHENSVSLISYGRELLQGEVGAALAHQAAYGAFVDSEFHWAVILEDDVRFATETLDSDLILLLEEVSQEMDSPMVVLLGHSIPKSQATRIHSHALRKIHYIPTGAFAYLINRTAANVLLAKTGKVRFQADWPLSARKVSFLVPETRIVEHPTSNLSRVDFYSKRDRRHSSSQNIVCRALGIRNLEGLLAWWHLAVIRGSYLRLMRRRRRLPMNKLAIRNNDI